MMTPDKTIHSQSINQCSLSKILHFKNMIFWDARRYTVNYFDSPFEIEPLKNHIIHQNLKEKPYKSPGKDFKILGVNNKTGLFDAYIEKGENLKQPYKQVKNGFLVYNPYRVNVGSIGIKTKKHRHRYISPAYVIFSCKQALKPEFLYLIFKTNQLNRMIRNNTSGSVRQNFSFSRLGEMNIPVPDKETQDQLVHHYNDLQSWADRGENQARALEQEIEDYLMKTLGIKIKTLETREGLQFIGYKSFGNRVWSVDHCLNPKTVMEDFKESKYPLVKFGEILKSFQYGISEKSSIKEPGVPIIRMNNIIDSELILDNIKYLQSPFCGPGHLLNKGDLLFNRTNSKELVGKTAVFDKEGTYTFASYLIRIRLLAEKANVYFINYLFNSKIMRRQIHMVSRQNLGQANVNSKELKNFLVPLPPLEIQRSIALNIKKLKIRIKHLKKGAEQLRSEAIKMFEDELYN
jgi:type I restriction enzyme S subunit